MKTSNARERNVSMLRFVAESMGDARERVVFLGGTVIPFLLTQQVPLEPRPSKDVDFIFDYSSKQELHDFEDMLWERGFVKLRTGSVSQWTIRDVTVDVLPAGPVLGFSNRWCDEAVRNAVRADIGKGMSINMIPAPCFLGAKLAKFGNRDDDYSNSSDIYDLLLVMAGRPAIELEVMTLANLELKDYLADELAGLLDRRSDLRALLHVYAGYGERASTCLSIAVTRIRSILDERRGKTESR